MTSQLVMGPKSHSIESFAFKAARMHEKVAPRLVIGSRCRWSCTLGHNLACVTLVEQSLVAISSVTASANAQLARFSSLQR